jgi:hypothetical protein
MISSTKICLLEKVQPDSLQSLCTSGEENDLLAHRYLCNISNPTMKTGLDFKTVQFDWIKMQGLKI